MSFFYRITLRLVMVSMAALLVVLAHRTYQSLETYRDVETLHRSLQERVDSLKLENAELERENERLATDFSYYEQLGREEFGMIKEGETIYIVPLP